MPIENDKKWLLSYIAKCVKKIYSHGRSPNLVVSIQLKSFMEVDLMKVTRYQHIFLFFLKSVTKIGLLKVTRHCCYHISQKASRKFLH